MGKIVSGPKAPSTQVIVQNPTSSVNAASSVDATTDSTTTDTTTNNEQDSQAISTALRQESLLRRSRGRLGTITSSFKGFFDTVGDSISTARKTLLGE